MSSFANYLGLLLMFAFVLSQMIPVMRATLMTRADGSLKRNQTRREEKVAKGVKGRVRERNVNPSVKLVKTTKADSGTLW